MAAPGGTNPCTWMVIERGPRVVSPPTSLTPWARARVSRPRAKAGSQPGSSRGSSRGRVRARVAQAGSAPMAARSLRPTARDLWPRDSGSQSGRKWTPLARVSMLRASRWPGGTASRAQSSPTPSSTSARGAPRSAEIGADQIEFRHGRFFAAGAAWRMGGEGRLSRAGNPDPRLAQRSKGKPRGTGPDRSRRPLGPPRPPKRLRATVG